MLRFVHKPQNKSCVTVFSQREQQKSDLKIITSIKIKIRDCHQQIHFLMKVKFLHNLSKVGIDIIKILIQNKIRF